jgi:hypothetical protein
MRAFAGTLRRTISGKRGLSCDVSAVASAIVVTWLRQEPPPGHRSPVSGRCVRVDRSQGALPLADVGFPGVRFVGFQGGSTEFPNDHMRRRYLRIHEE